VGVGISSGSYGGFIGVTRDGNTPVEINRKTSDGNLITLRKDGSTVGSIGTAAGDLYIGTGDTGLSFGDGSDVIVPVSSTSSRDAAISLGVSTNRFKDLYLSNNATAQKLTLTKAPVGLFTIEVDGTNTGQPNLIVKKSTSEALRIDNNNNLLVGTTSAYGTTGTTINAAGLVYSSADGDRAGQFDRTTSDGEIVRFSKAGSTVGSIGVIHGNNLFIGAPSHSGLQFGGSIIYPTNGTVGNATNGAVDLGGVSTRFKDLYLSGTANANRYAHDGDSDTYFSFPAANQLSLVAGGAEVVRAYQIAGSYGVLKVNGSGSQTYPNFTFNGDDNTGMYRATTDTLAFTTGGQEAARIDASQNLLVGKSSSALQNAGVEIRPTNLMSTRINGDALSLNRRSSDGAIASFYRDGVIKGAIGSDATHPDGSEYSGATLYIGAGDAGLGFTDNGDCIYPYDVDSNTPRDGTITLGHSSTRFKDLYLSGGVNIGDAKTVGHGAISLKYDLVYMTAGVISPSNSNGTDNDNAIDLGKSSARFDDIFATNGTIQTSDRNEKQDIEDLTEAEERVAIAAKGLLKKFRWKSAVEDKGDDARIHFGIIAQDLQDAFEAEGLDAGRYGMFISTTWTDEDGEEQTRMGVRYSELLAFIISAI